MQRDGDYWPAVTVAAGSRECNANAAVTGFTTASFSNASAAVTLAGEPGGRGRLVVMTAPKLAADNVQGFSEAILVPIGLEVIVIDLMTTPAVPPEKRNFYAQALLRELATTTLRQWGLRGVEITSLYACGSTDAGRRLLRNKWFTELSEPVSGRVIFELPDVLHSDFHLLKPYQEAYAEWQQEHKG